MIVIVCVAAASGVNVSVFKEGTTLTSAGAMDPVFVAATWANNGNSVTYTGSVLYKFDVSSTRLAVTCRKHEG